MLVRGKEGKEKRSEERRGDEGKGRERSKRCTWIIDAASSSSSSFLFLSSNESSPTFHNLSQFSPILSSPILSYPVTPVPLAAKQRRGCVVYTSFLSLFFLSLFFEPLIRVQPTPFQPLNGTRKGSVMERREFSFPRKQRSFVSFWGRGRERERKGGEWRGERKERKGFANSDCQKEGEGEKEFKEA